MRRLTALIASLSLLLTAALAPAAAAPPEEVEEPVFIVFPDLRYNLAVFWNITRDDLCDWVDSGFAGPPPVTQPVSVQFNELTTGAVVISFKATAHLELWQLDPDADLSGPCEDTAGSAGPWATGSAHVVNNDNDLFVSGTRMNAFGERAQGTVMDAAGTTYHYSWVFRALIDRDEEFRVVVPDRSVLVPRGS